MVAKSQAELEQPAKVYQLDAVETKVDQALVKLEAILGSVTGVVTNAQLEASIKKVEDDLRKEFTEAIDNEVKAIHLKYNPTYRGIWWVVGVLFTSLIGLVIASINGLWGDR